MGHSMLDLQARLLSKGGMLQSTYHMKLARAGWGTIRVKDRPINHVMFTVHVLHELHYQADPASKLIWQQ